MSRLFILLIRVYQIIFSPLLHTILPLPHHCRFNPTCSQYTIISIKKHGSYHGLKAGLNQFLHCHPFNH